VFFVGLFVGELYADYYNSVLTRSVIECTASEIMAADWDTIPATILNADSPTFTKMLLRATLIAICSFECFINMPLSPQGTKKRTCGTFFCPADALYMPSAAAFAAQPHKPKINLLYKFRVYRLLSLLIRL